jgi:hypothetical protein
MYEQKHIIAKTQSASKVNSNISPQNFEFSFVLYTFVSYFSKNHLVNNI